MQLTYPTDLLGFNVYFFDDIVRPSDSLDILASFSSTIPKKSSLVNRFSSKTWNISLCSLGFTYKNQILLHSETNIR